MKIKAGFTLFELMIVIVLIGVLGTMVMPNLKSRIPRYEREAFIARFNALTQLGWRRALITHSLQKISIDIKKRIMTLSASTGEVDRSGEPIFKPSTGLAEATELTVPDQYDIKQCFIEGFDMMAKYSTRKTEEMWFYITPQGIAQDVIINFIDSRDMINDMPRQVGLVLNPFSAQFRIYDAFQKP